MMITPDIQKLIDCDYKVRLLAEGREEYQGL